MTISMATREGRDRRLKALIPGGIQIATLGVIDRPPIAGAIAARCPLQFPPQGFKSAFQRSQPAANLLLIALIQQPRKMARQLPMPPRSVSLMHLPITR